MINFDFYTPTRVLFGAVKPYEKSKKDSADKYFVYNICQHVSYDIRMW